MSSGADPTSAISAIGYIQPNVTATVGPVGVPTNTYTLSTGVMNLNIGVWMLSLEYIYTSASSVQSFTFNMGFMSSAPVTGDSATASSAPLNTIANINGNLRYSDTTNLDNGTSIRQIGGVVINNYGGTFNTIYGIANWKFITSGTITATVALRAVKIG